MKRCTNCEWIVLDEAEACPHCGSNELGAADPSEISFFEAMAFIKERDIAIAFDKERCLAELRKITPAREKEIALLGYAFDIGAIAKIAAFNIPAARDVMKHAYMSVEAVDLLLDAYTGEPGHSMIENQESISREERRAIIAANRQRFFSSEPVPLLDLTLEDASPTQRVIFGSYPQAGSVPEDLLWTIRAIEGDAVVLITERSVECKCYNDEWDEVTWEKSSLHAWLNGVFYRAAFSAEEREHIVQSLISTPSSATFGTIGGEDTMDYVYCLSAAEADIFFKGDECRVCRPTANAFQGGVTTFGERDTGGWWLRSPGLYQFHAAYVGYNGRISTRGCDVNHEDIGVRPVIRVRLAK